MTKTSEAVELYLRQLSQGIEALGPKEAAEVVAEVRAHLSEAVLDADGDEATVLEHFGSADVFAARILEERGAVVGAGTLPEAPEGRQRIALLVDVFLWVAGVLAAYLALLLLGVRMVDFITARQTGDFDLVAFLQALNIAVDVLALAAAAALGWWLLRARRRPGAHSPGMRLLGLRRIRFAQETRVVRLRQVPGMKRSWPVAASVAVILGVAVLVAWGWIGAQGNRNRDEGIAITAVQDSASAVRTVSNLYQRVTRDMPAVATPDTYLLTAKDAMAALSARRAKGAVAAYAIQMTELSDAAARVGLPAPGQTLDAVVTVNEYGSISETIHTQWAYHLRYGEVTNADGSSGWSWRITSVAPSNNEY